VALRFAFWKRGLGTLERKVMEVVWRSAGDLSVREVHEQLRQSVAYTTVMTTLDRLFKKGLLSRAKDGKAYRYSSAVARHELTVQLVSNLVDDIGETDRELLDGLDRFVRERRRKLES
jgi:predicted transcriptional regulator